MRARDETQIHCRVVPQRCCADKFTHKRAPTRCTFVHKKQKKKQKRRKKTRTPSVKLAPAFTVWRIFEKRGKEKEKYSMRFRRARDISTTLVIA